MFGISRWCRHLRPFLRRLVPFRGDVKKDRFLQRLGAIAAQQTEIHPIRQAGLHHHVKSISGIHMKLNARLEADALIGWNLRIGEMPEQAAVRVGTLPEAFDFEGLRRLHLGCAIETQQHRGRAGHHRHNANRPSNPPDPRRRCRGSADRRATGMSPLE